MFYSGETTALLITMGPILVTLQMLTFNNLFSTPRLEHCLNKTSLAGIVIRLLYDKAKV